MSSADFQEGQCAAHQALAGWQDTPEHQERCELLVDAISGLIDAALGWNNVAPTKERLAGFADVLVHFVAPHGAQRVGHDEAAHVIARAVEGSRVAAALYEPLKAVRHA